MTDSADMVCVITEGVQRQGHGPEGSPELTVVVCTLGEAAVDETVSSIAASAGRAGRAVEVVVVWQGVEPPPQLGDGVEVLDVFPVGLSYARNRGLATARAPIVAFVDDDEVVDPAWVAGVTAAFEGERSLDGVFGPVAPLDDRGLPYCHYEGGEHRVFSERGTPPWVVGTGGNMAFRRDVLTAAGGFDNRFGIGAPGRSAEEFDLVVRLLGDGRLLAFSPEMPVYHPSKNEHEHLASRYPYGFGMGSVMRRHRKPALAGRYLITIGQVLAESLRRGDARRRREVLATLRSFLAGMLSPGDSVSPVSALERLPGELREALGGMVPEPLGATLDDRPHYRYAAGDGRLLHLYLSPTPELADSVHSGDGSGESRVLAHAVDRDALWVLERAGAVVGDMHDYDRKTSEQRFHDDLYTEETRAGLAKYYTVLRASLGQFRSAARAAAAGADVLEYGCGAEPHALDVARVAATVVGIDLSPVAVEHAAAAAAEAGLAHARFRVMDAEALEFDDDSFDLVYGSAILHHLDVSRALTEIARVLRPSGKALFIEPMGHNPAINFYRRLTPALRTPDEHPLRMADLRVASSFFRSADYRFYDLCSLAAVPFRSTRAFGKLLSGLDAVDRLLFAAVPPARRMAWYVVMTLRDPNKGQ